MTINGRPTVNAATIGGMHPFYTAPHADARAPVGCLSQEKRDRCIIDAARSFSYMLPGMCHGSACAELIEFSEACYGECPRGGNTGDN